MRVFINERRVKRNRQLANVLVFLSMGIFVAGLILNYAAPRDNAVLAVLPVLILPIGLIAAWLGVRLMNQFVREPHPEDALLVGLKGTSHHSALYHYLFKANHVLISQSGVFAFVTRFQEGAIQVRGERVISLKTRGLLGALFSFLRQDQIGNPIRDARAAAAELETRIKAALPGTSIMVQPVVVFISEKAELDVQDPAIPVVLASAKKKPNLKGLMRDGKKGGAPALSTAQLNTLIAALNSSLSIGDSQSQLVAEEEA